MLVPVYKVERFIERCARSLFEQTLEDMEFVFVNDCTPDGSMAVLARVLDDYPNRISQVHVINHDRNMGSGAARQTLLDAASGEFLAYLDSDDWVELDMYDRMLSMAESEEADVVCCGFVAEIGTYAMMVCHPVWYDDKEGLKDPLNWTILYQCTWNKLIRRSVFVDNEICFVEGINYGEDVLPITQARYFSRRTVLIREAMVHYNRQNEGAMTAAPSLRMTNDWIRAAAEIERFFGGRPDAEEYRLLVNWVKFWSKDRLLLSPEYGDVNRWRTTFKESNGDFARYPYGGVARWVLGLAVSGMPRAAHVVVKAKAAVGRCVRRVVKLKRKW